MVSPWLQARIIWLVVLALLTGCGNGPKPPELLALTEVTPSALVEGERVEVRGVGLPVGDAAKARVVFSGSLQRAGELADPNVEITVAGANVERDRIWFELDAATAARFLGPAADGRHATFRGSVEVWLPGTRQGLPVYGSVKGTTSLDVTPSLEGGGAGRELDERAREQLEHWGMTLETGPGGVFVASLRAAGPAEQAGLAVGDRLTRLGGLSVHSPRDLAAPDGETSLVIAYERQGQSGQAELGLPVESIHRPGGWLTAVAILLGALVTVGLLGSRVGRALDFVVVRLSLRRRPRPRAHAQTGLAGAARDALTAAAPVLVFVITSATFVLVPLAELSGRAALDIAVLYLVSLTSFVSMGAVTGAWRSGSGRIGSRARGLVGLLTVQLPALLSLAVIVTETGSLSVSDIVAAQASAHAAVPLGYHALQSPQLLLLFAFFFVSTIVEPGDQPQRGGQRGLFFFAQWTNTFVMCAIATIAFFGGYHVPGVPLERLAESPAWMGIAAACFALKCWGLAGLVLLARHALPRMRVETLLRLGLSRVAPASAAVAVLAVALHFYPLVPSARAILSTATLLGASAILLIATFGAFELRRRPGAGPRVNTLL